MEECNQIKACLLHYEKASGQKVNLEKSSVMFCLNIQEDKKRGTLLTVSSVKELNRRR